jgi:cob(I)alamin adenosyltransferase
MLVINTGNGKGKTTAALGSALRAVGEGKRVLMIQFIKGPWKSGEDDSFSRLAPDFKLVKMGKGFVGIMGDDLPREVHAKAAADALAFAESEARTGTWDMIILDEVHNALHLNLISLGSVLSFLDEAEETVPFLVFTGRDAPPELIERAEIVTEMKEVKHIYNEGVKGKKGLEY